ncbi:hypothetical protein N9955_00770 [bacterium]|nr:hypothetical protein [bacterium]
MPTESKLEDIIKSQFEGSVRVISNEEFEHFGISKASYVAQARTLLPNDFEPNQNVDVLPVVFNLAKINEFNKNGDGISTADAIDMVKRFANKPINIEHKKTKIVGHIINASFSDKEPDFQENDIEDFRGRTDPFFINAAGVIYRHVYPNLGEIVEESSEEESEEYQSISTSWELGFKDWVVAVGSLKVEECEIFSDELSKQKYKQYIKKYGGMGVDEKGVPVNRLIVGKTVPLGGALTYNPAADVTGVYTLEDKLAESNAKKIINFNERQEKNSQETKNDVKNKKSTDNIIMNEEQIKELIKGFEQSVASVIKEESTAKSVGELVRETLKEQGSVWESKVAASEKAKAKTEQDLQDLQSSFSETQKELTDIKTQMETQARAELFNARMNSLEEKFEFNEDELKFVTAEVKDLDSEEETFASYEEKVNTLFSHKLKTAIASQEEELKRKIDEEVAKRTKTKASSEESNASEEEDKAPEKEEESEEEGAEKDLETEGAVADITNNNAGSTKEISLIEKAKQSFSVQVTK